MKLNNNDDSHNSGLNLLIYNMLLDIGSHPAWVCGLKLKKIISEQGILCHTLRGCVDWNLPRCILLSLLLVTPCVGVWIETFCSGVRRALVIVTPCVGVWIETWLRRICVISAWSHPAWVCGLKPLLDWNLTGQSRHTLRGCVDWN